jgi:hypothetical protein
VSRIYGLLPAIAAFQEFQVLLLVVIVPMETRKGQEICSGKFSNQLPALSTPSRRRTKGRMDAKVLEQRESKT